MVLANTKQHSANTNTYIDRNLNTWGYIDNMFTIRQHPLKELYSLVSIVISIFLYACESWPLTAELEKRTQAFEMRCYQRQLNISYKDRVTNEEVHRKIQAAIGEYDELLTLVKKQKLRLFGHVIEGIVALTIKGRLLRKYKGESSHSCTQHIIKTCST